MLFGSLRSGVRARSVAGKIRSRQLAVEQLEDRCVPAAGFLQTNLVSDIPGMAQVLDPNLVNSWGLTASATSPLWVADQGTGVSTLYNGQGGIMPLVVHIPNANPPSEPHGPTGTVFNIAGKDFKVTEGTKTGSSIFLFDTLDGTISGWSPGVDRTHAIVAVRTPGAEYTGLAIATDSSGNTFLYAANFAAGTIDVFDSQFNPVTGGANFFRDSLIPGNFKPFNIQNINGMLYVEYASPVAGQGNGFVDVFDSHGVLQQRLIHHGILDQPWGIALAPGNFGRFSNDLLVGNFGDGTINAFDPVNGHFIGTMTDGTGKAISIEHLWALRFGNGNTALHEDANTLFFTAGLTSHLFGTSSLPPHGLLGSLQALPNLSPDSPIIPNLGTGLEQTVNTVPATGDNNPYGVAFVPEGFEGGGLLHPGDLLVSNFNSSSGVQGTGTTIMRITPDGQHSVFFQGQQGLGLTTALGVLNEGFVLVGNVPNNNGVAGQGSLLIINSNGQMVEQFSDPNLLNGPWDLTIHQDGDEAQVFVSNVLSGTVTRIDMDIPEHGLPVVESMTQIASGYAHRPDPNALVVGPTGLAFDAARDILYVASTGDNAVFAISNAGHTWVDGGMGKLIFSDSVHLHGPLGLVLAPNGDLIASNGDAVNPDPNQVNELVEFTPTGHFVGQMPVDTSTTPGGAFGIALSATDGEIRFAAVDDNQNTVHIWNFAAGLDHDDGMFGTNHDATGDMASLIEALAFEQTKQGRG